MSSLYYMTANGMLAMAMQHIVLQQQLIAAQQTIIELQQRIDEMTPKNAPDDELLWHIASGGMMSLEAAQSDDIEVVRRFKDWNIEFAEKHLKPYINPKVYMETLSQMTRGLPEHLAELETKQEFEKLAQLRRSKSEEKPILQIPLALKEG